MPKTDALRNCRFFMSLEDDTELEWRGLTAREARHLYAITYAHAPYNAVSYGWETFGERYQLDEENPPC